MPGAARPTPASRHHLQRRFRYPQSALDAGATLHALGRVPPSYFSRSPGAWFEEARKNVVLFSEPATCLDGFSIQAALQSGIPSLPGGASSGTEAMGPPFDRCPERESRLCAGSTGGCPGKIAVFPDGYSTSVVPGPSPVPASVAYGLSEGDGGFPRRRLCSAGEGHRG